jgi:homoserine O-acetyltransferase/O-succinyltransferase
MALDLGRYFIIIPNMFGNGLSTSPNNVPPPYDRGRFPGVTLYDNVRQQHRLLTERFDINEVALVVGWSMGAQQSYQWGALYPDMVARIAPFCGSARTSRHNFVFLEGVKAALTADDAWQGGWYDKPPTKGLRAMGRVYAGWGFSQAFYRQELDLKMGFASLEDFLIGFWEGIFLGRDANNLLAMLWTWQNGDISANELYNGDFEKALGAIKARAIVMPGQTDLYFPPEDNEYEVGHMPNAECRPIPSVWDHCAGCMGLNPPDAKFIDDTLKELLAS